MPTRYPETLAALFGRLWRTLTIRFDKKPIDSIERLTDFIRTRSSYVAQTSLYGYLKARMGIQYPEIFQSEAFAGSINIAKWRTYIACQSDLTVFATALVLKEAGIGYEHARELARFCFETSLRATAAEGGLDVDIDAAAARFAERVDGVLWSNAAIGESAFTESPAALFAAAPVAHELKVHDEEIVRNSIRFRWRDVREQLRSRIDGAAVWRDWIGSAGRRQH